MKKLLVLLFALFAFACAGTDETSFDPEVDQLEQELNYVTGVNSVTPSSFTRDFNDAIDTPCCYWVSFAYWTSVSDVAAGAFTAEIEYVDPIGETRVISGVPISLDDPTGFYSSPPAMIVRQAANSLWEINFTLIGPAGSSEMGYKVMHSAAASTDIQNW